MDLAEAHKALLDAGFEGVERCGFVLTDEDEGGLVLSRETKVKPGLCGYYRHYAKTKTWKGMFLLRPYVDPDIEDASVALKLIEQSSDQGLFTVSIEETHADPLNALLEEGGADNLTLAQAVSLILEVCIRTTLN